jgi:nucleotide-binding universal stress UspA family protein
VVLVVHKGQSAYGLGRVDAEWGAYERDQAEATLAEARQILAGLENVEFRRVDSSSAGHGLSDVVEEGGTMLVLGARKARGLRRTYPGSTAERLLHGSTIPIAIVPSDYATRHSGPLKTVTAAYVDTTDGRHALRVAAQIAEHLGAHLDVVSVIPDTRVTGGGGEPRQFESGQHDAYRTALDAAVASVSGHVKATGRLLDGPIVDALVEIGPDETDLLVCGSRGYGPVARVLLGGVSGRVVRHARVPTAVVPRARS